MADTSLLLAAALMLVGAVVAAGAWLLPHRAQRYLLVVVGAGLAAGGVIALTGALR